MSITQISDFFLVSSEDGTQVSSEVFRTREAAQARIDRAPAEIRDEITVKEVAVPARFLAIVSRRDGLRAEAENYAWFGSRVVAEGPFWVVMGCTLDHWYSQSQRLSSGILGNRVYDTLEEAVAAAEEMATFIYGTR